MINEIMIFPTYNDFFNRRNIIKREFKKLNTDDKRVYRMYLHAQRELSTAKVELIWEFLNEPDNSCYCPTEEQLKQYFVQKLEHEIKYNDDYRFEDDDKEDDKFEY